MNSASPDARDSGFARYWRVGGQLRRAGELAGRAGECAGLLALERHRPGGEHAGALAGGVRDRGGLCAGGAQLLADALELRRAAVPHQAALLELGLALAAGDRRPAGVDELHSVTARRRASSSCLPPAPQCGERQVARQAAAAVPHAPPRAVARRRGDGRSSRRPRRCRPRRSGGGLGRLRSRSRRTNSLSSRLAVAQARTIRSSVCRLERSGVLARGRRAAGRGGDRRPARRASGRGFRPRGCAPPGAAARTAARAPGTPSARAAGRCARWPCCRPRPPGSPRCGRGRSRPQSARDGSPPTGTAPWRVSPAKPICSMNCSQISAHRSSASSGSCGCRLSEQCHTCASRDADHPPVLVALGDRHPGAERLARLVEEPRQRDRVASARASLAPPPSGPPPASPRPGAGRRAPRACPSRPGRCSTPCVLPPRVTFGITA